MKRLQLMIEEELDAALARKAGAEGTSKAALIRRYVRERLKPLPPPEADPLWQMAGVDDYESEAVDDVVYRRSMSTRPSGSLCGTGATLTTPTPRGSTATTRTPGW